ncbi:MAG: SDR family oxidoreductase [Bacteroidota bacterium]|nr:SDR family oxidoreductase [Bacteroidota bacterium]
MTKTVLITGATTGIGYELSKLFAKDKYDLIITARSESKLKEVSEKLSKEFSVNVKFITKDLAKSGAAKELYEEVKNEKKNIDIDILVNNAGFGTHGSFGGSDPDTDLEMIQLNVTSLVALTKFFLNDMIKINSGKIMNVASTAAFQPGPMMAIYYATKSFVLSFSEAIDEELSDTKISVTAFCPGPTKTEFQVRAGIKNTKLVNKGFSSMMSAEEAARAGYHGLMKGKRIVIPGLMNKVFPQLIRFSPRNLVTKAVRFIHKE